MKRFLLASVIGLTLTATAATVFADDAPAADKPADPPAATTAAPVAPPPPPPAAVAPPPAAKSVVVVAQAPAPTTAQPAKPVVAAPPAPAPAPEPVVFVTTPAPAPAPSGTPLHIAQTASASQPLQLAPQTEGMGWGYKLLAIVVIAGGVALYLKKKKGFKLPGEVVPSKIDILGKSSVGVRSQLVVVEVEGTRLLIGMTPTSIATLAVLQTPDDDVQPASSRSPSTSQLTTSSALASLTERADRAEQDAFRPANLGDRVRSLLGSDEPISSPRLTSVKQVVAKPRPRPSRPTATRPKVASNTEIAGQARGLLLSDDEDS